MQRKNRTGLSLRAVGDTLRTIIQKQEKQRPCDGFLADASLLSSFTHTHTHKPPSHKKSTRCVEETEVRLQGGGRKLGLFL